MGVCFYLIYIVSVSAEDNFLHEIWQKGSAAGELVSLCVRHSTGRCV